MGRWGRGRGRYDGYSQWPEYVPVSERKARAQAEAKKLAKKGEALEPVAIEGRTVARTFWGKAWCGHLESYSDYANRLPRGRNYLTNGFVLDLKVAAGKITALVSGSELYTIEIAVTRLEAGRWKKLKGACAGRIDSLVELLQGRLADDVMREVCHRETGLFPAPREIRLACSCPDSAALCKHLAAALYGLGARLDARPELLFVLRGVDHLELVAGAASAAPRVSDAGAERLEEPDLGELFGIELAGTAVPTDTAPASEEPGLDLFRVGEEVDATDLAAIGIERAVYQAWIKAGWLVRTKKRGVWLATPELNRAVLEALE